MPALRLIVPSYVKEHRSFSNRWFPRSQSVLRIAPAGGWTTISRAACLLIARLPPTASSRTPKNAGCSSRTWPAFCSCVRKLLLPAAPDSSQHVNDGRPGPQVPGGDHAVNLGRERHAARA